MMNHPPPTPIETLDAALTYGGGEISESLAIVDESPNEDAGDRKPSKSKDALQKDAVLAKRTSQILNSYRDFLYDQDLMDGEEVSCYKSRLGQMSSNHRGPGFARKGSNGSSNAETGLLRDFSVPHDIEIGANERRGKRKYKLPPPDVLLQSKRVKTGLVTAFALLAVIAVVIGTTSKGSTAKSNIPARGKAPGWHSEAAYILEHERGDQSARLSNYDAFVEQPSGESLTSYDFTEPSAESEDGAEVEPVVTKDNGKKPTAALPNVEAEDGYWSKSSNAPAASDVASFNLRQILHDRFKPLWLSAREGWNGGSVEDALQYCRSIRDMELCPYSAICPEGPGRAVMAGRRPVNFSGEQYAPAFGHKNRWVMVGQKDGDPASTCRSHEELEGSEPEWGLTKENPEKKLHVMCCNTPSNRRQ